MTPAEEITVLRLALSASVLMLIRHGIGNFGPNAYEVSKEYFEARANPEGYMEPLVYEGLESVNRGSAS